ncbi:small acid-soluble spore protein Tlp [Cohnella hongkongensis]|uniref:Small acid-soluble spore protein Tlp n=1 Tax=Cohnella hongkongensis TaxID=178337 RepID=A0ABV9F9T4_9BACL
MAKPDDRSDNAEKLKEAVQNTVRNLEESEHYLDEHAVELSPEESETLRQKNENRREALDSLRSEIKDEQEYAE